MMPFQLKKNLSENMEYFDQELRVDVSFDVIKKNFITGGKKACLYFVDGFAKDDALQKLLEKLEALKAEEFQKNAHDYMKHNIAYIEADKVTDAQDIVKNILSGVAILLIDSYEEAIAIDARSYPVRGVEEPDTDKVIRGSRDGFVETIVFNTALIRRRIRTPKLINKMLSVGASSQTDIVVSYIEGRCNQKLLETVLTKIQNITVDSLSMNQESLAECMFERGWINPFPKFKYTERPDTAAACLLEGNIIILIDNSPAAMIVPASLFDIIEEANDYYFPPITGTYLRLSRYLINVVAILLTPTFLLLMNNPELLPKMFEFIKVKEEMNIPIIFQFLILELAVDGLKLASINTPSMLSTPLSVISALVIGDFAVSSGWFNSETMLYMAFVVLATYTQTSFEFGYALKFMRIILLILTSIFGIWGYIVGIIVTFLCMALTKTISGRNYIYPLIPFDGKKLWRKFFRLSLPNSRYQNGK